MMIVIPSEMLTMQRCMGMIIMRTAGDAQDANDDFQPN